ncbi:MAG: hypothetical protein HQL88_08390 [Magnetococcales bacterium]|nr:hypothetical protein [Magnetococcales bacterium]
MNRQRLGRRAAYLLSLSVFCVCLGVTAGRGLAGEALGEGTVEQAEALLTVSPPDGPAPRLEGRSESPLLPVDAESAKGVTTGVPDASPVVDLSPVEEPAGSGASTLSLPDRRSDQPVVGVSPTVPPVAAEQPASVPQAPVVAAPPSSVAPAVADQPAVSVPQAPVVAAPPSSVAPAVADQPAVSVPKAPAVVARQGSAAAPQVAPAAPPSGNRGVFETARQASPAGAPPLSPSRVAGQSSGSGASVGSGPPWMGGQPPPFSFDPSRGMPYSQGGWNSGWHGRFLYQINQQIYWRYCASCHGFLPPVAVHALLGRAARQWGDPGFSGNPDAWKAGSGSRDR